tara:strand:+ start:274 stop:531 length:258 start_codon:yes stop_codon:yes gene_type:complete
MSIPQNTMQTCTDMLVEAGVSDSRLTNLRDALVRIHWAYCDLDSPSRENFKRLCGDRKFHEVLEMIASAEYTPLLRDKHNLNNDL